MKTENQRSQYLKMARYSMRAELGGNVSPIIWDTTEFNHGIIYNGGFITIDEPGYYRVQTSCYNGSHDSGVGCHLMVNSKRLLVNYSRFSAVGTASGIFNFDLFDTVYVKKEWNELKLEKGSAANYFSIEKL